MIFAIRCEEVDDKAEFLKAPIQNLIYAQKAVAEALKEAFGSYNMPPEAVAGKVFTDFNLKDMEYIFAVYNPWYPPCPPSQELPKVRLEKAVEPVK